MGFVDDYNDYNRWKTSLDDSPAAWEKHRQLKADAQFYLENKEDITEALDMLYQARKWWATNSSSGLQEIGRWFNYTFGDQLTDFCFSDDDVPF